MQDLRQPISAVSILIDESGKEIDKKSVTDTVNGSVPTTTTEKPKDSSDADKDKDKDKDNDKVSDDN